MLLQPDAKRAQRELDTAHTLGLSYAPSSATANSDDGMSSEKGKHVRRPSGAVSFTSTIPDGTSPTSGGDIEKGETPAEEEDAPAPRKWLGIFPRAPKKDLAPVVKPDPTPEEMAPFSTALTPSALYSLFDPKSYTQLASMGGTTAILDGLRTDPKTGLSDSQSEIALSERDRVYGANRVPQRPGKSFLLLCWMAYQDKVLVSPLLPPPQLQL